jgi:hypothetical protein
MTTDSTIRLAVIGLGRMGRFHLDTFRSLAPWVQVTAIADPYRPSVDQSRALAPGARTFDDPIECWDSGGFDAALVVSPVVQLGCGYRDANCVTTGQRCSPGWSGVNARLSTRDGHPVAELQPLPTGSEGPTELIERRKRLPRVDPEALRRAVDTVVDASLS